jgi:hypothetical protein
MMSSMYPQMRMRVPRIPRFFQFELLMNVARPARL